MLACFDPLLGGAMYILVAAIWLVPDRRFEKQLDAAKKEV
jgi:hypothetical protein